MITLRTLHKATAQEVFDQVAAHLLKQNERCLYNDACAYRSDDGKLACAAGCLISEEEMAFVYDKGYNQGAGILTLLNDAISDGVADRESIQHLSLIGRLQAIHDGVVPSSWRASLKAAAEEFNLKWNFDNTGE